MATQALRVLDTIAAMKRAIHNEHDFSDSEEEAARPTNRGYKLKRKAEHFHEGELGGARPYKKRVNHVGYPRFILHRNPKRYDEYGYELEDDDEDEEADAEVAERNPYNEVSIERLLMPLTSASDLPDHPAMSIPYKSQILPDMIKQTREGLLKERRILASLKLLLTKFRGDHIWIPVDQFCTVQDDGLFMRGVLSADALLPADALALLNGTRLPQYGPSSVITGALETPTDRMSVENPADIPFLAIEDDKADGKGSIHEEDGVAASSDNTAHARTSKDNRGNPDATGTDQETSRPDGGDGSPENVLTENLSQRANGVNSTAIQPRSTVDGQDSRRNDEDAMEDPSPPPRMLTRGQAQAQVTEASHHSNNSSRSRTASPASSDMPIHPLFIPPASALANRDCGLNPLAADETRRLLSATVQKQEETVRLLERMYDGLLMAERLRKSVWSWCRAEGHADELSDNEDYVDLEEWGLDSPLVKGQEDADESGEKEGKKTRGGRRTAQ